MANTKKTTSATTTQPEETTNVDVTEYAPTETRVITPEEAANEVVNNDAAAATDVRVVEPVEDTPTRNNVTIKDGYIIHRVNEEEAKGLPIATSGDDNYQAVLKDSSVDYTATTKGEKNDLKK